MGKKSESEGQSQKRKCEPLRASSQELLPDVNKNDNPCSEDDDGDDDDLPAPFTPVKKVACDGDFKQGDLLFAKFKQYPYWPGLFHSYSCKKRGKRKPVAAWVYFFEHATVDTKRVLRVPLGKIKTFTCDDRGEIIEQGNSNDDFKFGMDLASDYITKRALGKVTEFFMDVIEQDDEEDSEHEEEKKSEEIINEDEVKDDEESICSPTKRLKLRTSRRTISNKCKDVVDWIKNHSKSLLLDIVNGKLKSTRHDTFVNGTQGERDKLKWSSGFGCLGEQQSDYVFDLLLEWYREEFPNRVHNVIGYVSEVWLPEAIIHGISKSRNVSIEEAEKQYLWS